MASRQLYPGDCNIYPGNYNTVFRKIIKLLKVYQNYDNGTFYYFFTRDHNSEMERDFIKIDKVVQKCREDLRLPEDYFSADDLKGYIEIFIKEVANHRDRFRQRHIICHKVVHIPEYVYISYDGSDGLYECTNMFHCDCSMVNDGCSAAQIAWQKKDFPKQEPSVW